MSLQIDRTAAAFVHDAQNKVLKVREANLSNTPLPVEPSELTTFEALNLYGWILLNPNAVSVFVKLYDSKTPPTVGMDEPVMTLQIAANGQVVFFGSDPINFTDNMYQAVTTEYDDAGTTAPALDCITNLFVR